MEEIGSRIDEAIKTTQDIESIIMKLGRYDESTFQDCQISKLSDAELKRLTHEASQRLDKFPRKNRHSQEWYEKYL